MITLVEHNVEHNYKIYRSEVIVQNKDAMVQRINDAHETLMRHYGHVGDNSTWLYRTYNIFSLVGPSEPFHELYCDLIQIIKSFWSGEKYMWFQSWLNFHAPNEVLDWHNHEWPVHGYISIDPKESNTVFTDYVIKNEVGNIYIGPGFRKHKVEVLKDYGGRRITLGFDVTNQQKLFNNLMSLIPIQ